MISLPFDSVEAGRRLGHDLYRYHWQPPAPASTRSIREGFRQAQARGGPRERGDRYARKWLQLRLGALRRGRVIDDGVTPDLLRSIDVDSCPVTRIALTHGTLRDSDWSVDRLNNDGAYVPQNLAVMSTRANRAKRDRSFAEVFALSALDQATEGLAPVEWLRLAALMHGPCFAESPGLAPLIPLNAPIPSGTLRLAVQQIQHVFAGKAQSQSGKNGLIKHFKPSSPLERDEFRLRELAERVHLGLKRTDRACDVWLQPGVMPALADWWEPLDGCSRARAGEISRALAGSQRVPPSRLQSWHLARRGYS